MMSSGALRGGDWLVYVYVNNKISMEKHKHGLSVSYHVHTVPYVTGDLQHSIASYKRPDHNPIATYTSIDQAE